MATTPVFLPRESHGQWSLVGYSPKGRKESNMAEMIQHAHNLLYGPTLTTVHDYWKKHSFDYTNLCQQSDVSAF